MSTGMTLNSLGQPDHGYEPEFESAIDSRARGHEVAVSRQRGSSCRYASHQTRSHCRSIILLLPWPSNLPFNDLISKVLSSSPISTRLRPRPCRQCVSIVYNTTKIISVEIPPADTAPATPHHLHNDQRQSDRAHRGGLSTIVQANLSHFDLEPQAPKLYYNSSVNPIIFILELTPATVGIWHLFRISYRALSAPVVRGR